MSKNADDVEFTRRVPITITGYVLMPETPDDLELMYDTRDLAAAVLMDYENDPASFLMDSLVDLKIEVGAAGDRIALVWGDDGQVTVHGLADSSYHETFTEGELTYRVPLYRLVADAAAPEEPQPCVKCGGTGRVPGMVTFGQPPQGAGWGDVPCPYCQGPLVAAGAAPLEPPEIELDMGGMGAYDAPCNNPDCEACDPVAAPLEPQEETL